MSEQPYTPTTDEVRAVWREWNGYGGLTYRTTPEPSRREMQQEFDRWLAGVKADALERAARDLRDDCGNDSKAIDTWYAAQLEELAAKYRQEADR